MICTKPLYKPLLFLLSFCLCAAALPARADTQTEADYFDDAVFFGDSLTVGLANYAQKQREQETPCLGKAQFLAELGYLIADTAQPDGYEKHPVYKGKRSNPFYSLQRMKPGKVFVLLGINDAFEETETVLARYDTLLYTLRKTLPDAQLIVQALLPMMAAREEVSFDNDKLRAINDGLWTLAQTHGAVFLDLRGAVEKDGALDPALCSDEYLHLNEAAYVAYVQQLTRFAAFRKAAQGPLQAQTVKRQIVISGRDIPSRTGRVLARIPGGVSFETLSKSGEWYEVLYSQQHMFVHESALLLTGSLPVTLSGSATLYDKPDENGGVVYNVAAGETLHALSDYFSADWLLTAESGQYGFIRQTSLQTDF